jgi:transcriptional regulator with XRE-family HTH domain
MKAGSLPLFRRRLGAALRDQRIALGLSQADLADRLHSNLTYVGRVERGEQNITMKTLERFLTALIGPIRSAPEQTRLSETEPPTTPGLLQAFAVTTGLPLPEIHGTPGQIMDADRAYDGAYVALNPTELQIVETCRTSPKSAPELLTALGYTTRTGHFNRALTHLLSIGLIELTRPAAPRSRCQKYRLTPKGRAFLADRPAAPPVTV